MQPLPLENLFLLDIETVSQAAGFDDLEDAWKDLWTEKSVKTLPPDMTVEEHYARRAALFAEFAQVICISTGYFRKEAGQWQLRIKSFYSANEAEVLEGFAHTLAPMQAKNSKWTFAGHNIREFDLPFLCRRMIVHRIALPSILDFQHLRPWETPVLDTLHLWRFGDFKHFISLKLLAATLGIPSPKDDIDGSTVGEVFWRENDLPRIAAYCQKDVATTAQIILRLRNLPLLQPEQIVIVE